MAFRIRHAGFDDLHAATSMLAVAWRQSYEGLVPDDVLDSRAADVAAQAERWAASMALGTYFWIVVDEDGQVVGVSNAQPARDEAAPASLELTMIYLLDVAKGTGIADRLLQMTIGDAPAYLWVLDGNERAIAFYRRHGFELTGRRQNLSMAGSAVPEVMMAR